MIINSLWKVSRIGNINIFNLSIYINEAEKWVRFRNLAN